MTWWRHHISIFSTICTFSLRATPVLYRKCLNISLRMKTTVIFFIRYKQGGKNNVGHLMLRQIFKSVLFIKINAFSIPANSNEAPNSNFRTRADIIMIFLPVDSKFFSDQNSVFFSLKIFFWKIDFSQICEL